MFDHIFRPSWYLHRINISVHCKVFFFFFNLDHLSYADDVRKEMTKPRIVPRTVKSWFEIPRSWCVSVDINDTTTYPNRKSSNCPVRTMTAQKVLTGGDKSEKNNFWPDIVDNGGLEFFEGKSTPKERIWGHHTGDGEEKVRLGLRNVALCLVVRKKKGFSHHVYICLSRQRVVYKKCIIETGRATPFITANRY